MDSTVTAPRHPLKFFRHAALAVSFLTLLPVPHRWIQEAPSDALARSFAFFPAVGLLLGALSLAPAYFLAPKASPLILATLSALCLCILTRALHLDGLADVADGFGGAYTPERRLLIMKDSRTGAFGASAITFIIILKVAALETLIAHHSWGSILIAPLLSRYSMVLAAYRNRYARAEGGLGQSFVECLSLYPVLFATLTALPFSWWLCGTSAIPPIFTLSLFIPLARLLSRSMIGGITGDVLGAICETSETVTWIVLAFFP